MRRFVWAACVLAFPAVAPAAAPHPSAGHAELSRNALAVLKTHCHRCHGQDGSVEGGFNFVLDRDRLVSRRKVVPGDAARSPLLAKVAAGKMPPPDVKSRPTPDEVAVLRRWITAGAPGASAAPPRRLITESEVLEWILADLDKTDRRSRRFVR